MSTEIKRKKGESFDGAFRRFQRRAQQGGIIKEIRRRRYREPVSNRNKNRVQKVRGLKIAVKRAWLLKTGKAEESDFSRRRRR